MQRCGFFSNSVTKDLIAIFWFIPNKLGLFGWWSFEAWKFEFLGVLGWKSKFKAPGVFLFSTKWVPLKNDNWWKFGDDISNHSWEIQNRTFFSFSFLPSWKENTFQKLCTKYEGSRFLGFKIPSKTSNGHGRPIFLSQNI